jgi:hypothetical protein
MAADSVSLANSTTHVRGQLDDDADTAIKTPITEIFSLFLIRPAVVAVYRNFKTWKFLETALARTDRLLAHDLETLRRKNIEELRTRLYLSKKMDLPGIISRLSIQLDSSDQHEQKVVVEQTRELFGMLRTRTAIRLGFSLAQLACKVAFTAGAVLAILSPLSWLGLIVLSTAGATSLALWGINSLCLRKNPLHHLTSTS